MTTAVMYCHVSLPMHNAREFEQPCICKQKKHVHLSYEMYSKEEHLCLHDSHGETKTLTYIWCYNNIYLMYITGQLLICLRTFI